MRHKPWQPRNSRRFAEINSHGQHFIPESRRSGPISPGLRHSSESWNPGARRQSPCAVLDTCLRVVSREIVCGLDGGFVAKASQSGSIVVADEDLEEGGALGLGAEAVLALVGAAGRMRGERVAEASVEALDHAVGLRTERPRALVAQAAGGADAVEGMRAGGLALWLAGLVDGEPVGEFAAVVGQPGVHLDGEGGERVCQECRPWCPCGRGGCRGRRSGWRGRWRHRRRRVHH